MENKINNTATYIIVLIRWDVLLLCSSASATVGGERYNGAVRKMFFNYGLRKLNLALFHPNIFFISRFLLNSCTSFRPVRSTCPGLLRLPATTKLPVGDCLLDIWNSRSL